MCWSIRANRRGASRPPRYRARPLRQCTQSRPRSDGMLQPCHRMAADASIALLDTSPVGVFSEYDKDTQGPLICALGQHARAEYRSFFLIVICRLHGAGRYGRLFPRSVEGRNGLDEVIRGQPFSLVTVVIDCDPEQSAIIEAEDHGYALRSVLTLPPASETTNGTAGCKATQPRRTSPPGRTAQHELRGTSRRSRPQPK